MEGNVHEAHMMEFEDFLADYYGTGHLQANVHDSEAHIYPDDVGIFADNPDDLPALISEFEALRAHLSEVTARPSHDWSSVYNIDTNLHEIEAFGTV